MHDPKISIVVPVYNVRAQIEKCLDSILAQTCTDWECLLVNDGSTDGSEAVCRAYAAADDRFILIDQANQGLSVARNHALEKASGAYVAFVDSDDWIMPGYLERMLTLMHDMEADIVMCGHHQGVIDTDEQEVQVSVMSGRDFTDRLIPDHVGGQLWQYLFRRSLWNGVVSPPGRYAQDMMILHLVTHRAKRIAITNEKLYFYYFDREDSTSNGKKKRCKGYFDRAVAFMIRCRFAMEHAYTARCAECYGKALDFYHSAVVSCEPNEHRYDRDMAELSQFLREYAGLRAQLPRVEQIRSLLLACMPRGYAALYRLIKRCIGQRPNS